MVDQHCACRADGEKVEGTGDLCTFGRVAKHRNLGTQIRIALIGKPGFQRRGALGH